MPRKINHVSSSNKKCKENLKKDSVMLDVTGMNPAQISIYVDNEVKTINDIKKFLVMMLTNIEAGK